MRISDWSSDVCASDLNIGAGGAAGILNTAAVNGGSGAAILNFNHSDAAYYFTDDGTATGAAVTITGSTAVKQIGTGTTILTGANKTGKAPRWERVRKEL